MQARLSSEEARNNELNKRLSEIQVNKIFKFESFLNNFTKSIIFLQKKESIRELEK